MLSFVIVFGGCKGPQPGTPEKRPSADSYPANPLPADSIEGSPASLDLLTTPGATQIFDPSILGKGADCDGAIIIKPDGVDDKQNYPNGPWKSIKYAASNLEKGETACVRGGTYTGRIDTAHAGEINAPIWLKEFPGEQVILQDANPGAVSPFIMIDQPYWAVDGLEINGRGSTGHAVRFQEPAHHSFARNITAYEGSATAAVWFYRSSSVALLGSTIHDWHQWTNAQGIKQESHGLLVSAGSHNVVLKGNHSWKNEGDSFQCAADVMETEIPSDITVSGNEFHEDVENAVDIKTCKQVTIENNRFYSYRPTNSSPASPSQPSSSPQGDAIVVHKNAKQILIQDNRIWDSGRAMSIGAATGPGIGDIGTVTVRNNVIRDMTAVQGSAATGAGIRAGARSLDKLEIYNNTFSGIPDFAIKLGNEGFVTHALVFNNIVDHAGMAVDIGTGGTTGGTRVFESDRNLFSESPRFEVDGRVVDLAGWQQAIQLQFPASPADSNSFLAHPFFVQNARQADFYTLPWSPARDVAASVGRPFCFGGPDIGAVETCVYFDDTAPEPVVMDAHIPTPDGHSKLVTVSTTSGHKEEVIPTRPTIALVALAKDQEAAVRHMSITGSATIVCEERDTGVGVVKNEVLGRDAPPVSKGATPVERLMQYSVDLGEISRCGQGLSFKSLQGTLKATAKNFEGRGASTASFSFRIPQ